MKKNILVLILSLILTTAFVSFAQGDDVLLNEETQTLSYIIDYDRLAINAEARECSQESFESGLLHGVLRHLFLFLPFEASYYDNVETLEVIVTQEEQNVLYATVALEEIKTTNKRFRVFMNSFASPRAGFCFSIGSNTLELWINTLTARQGLIAYNPSLFSTSIPGGISFAELEASQESSEITDTVVSVPNVANETTNEAVAPSEDQEDTLEATTQDTLNLADIEATEEETSPVLEAASTTNYTPVPYLTERPRRNFDQAESILEPDKDYAAIITTTKGEAFLDLFEDIAPNTVNNFVFLSRNKYYEDVSFFRVLEDFMAQTGDPTGSGLGGPGYEIQDEIVEGIGHSAAGIVSMASAGPNTAGSQFFVTFEATPWLDGNYTIFGAVLEGIEVFESLQLSDPSAPLAVATTDTTLGLLALQGITLEGSESFTFDSYLIQELGLLPPANQRLSIDGYDFMVFIDPESNGRFVSFWAQSDKILSVTIVERDK